MRLAIADPPYPPRITERYDLAGGGPRIVRRSRARRWYGDLTRGGHIPADFHPDASEWDQPERHRKLLDELAQNYDGWAIATTPDGLAFYHPLPIGCELLAWVKPRSAPGGSRLRGTWEAVIVFIPPSRRNGRGIVPTHLICSPRAIGFAGSKPTEWTHWVLNALGYDPAQDTVDDLFPGSGSVTTAIEAFS